MVDCPMSLNLVRRLPITAVLAVWTLAAVPSQAQTDEDIYRGAALAEFGEPHYAADFTHFDYADPTATVGGTLTLAGYGGFDTLNTIPLGGEFPRNIAALVFDTLMVASQDELSSFYPLIAQSVAYPEDRSWIEFTLTPDARWHDDTPITADDVVWTFEQIRAVGRPFLAAYYDDVDQAIVVDTHTVRFTFHTRDTMKPLMRVAELTVMPRHWWETEDRDIGSSILEPLLGSGPYRLVDVDPGQRLEYRRVEDYWAADLPARVGHFNVETLVYDYYLDRDIMFEAFKAGEVDFRHEFTSRNWATGYDIDAVDQGLIRREEVDVIRFRGLQGYFLNTRRAPFDDIRVREALSLLYPFEWVNERIMYGLYGRADSYFLGGDGWSARGLPEGRELELLEPFRDQVPPALFETAFRPENNGPRGLTRENAARAIALFAEAGWEIQDGAMTSVDTGDTLAFEILLRGPGLEPHTQPFVRALEQIGISASIAWVDSAQFQRRYQDRTFDAVSFAYTFYPPPGAELASYFGSAAADIDGSANVMGISDPVVDALIEQVTTAAALDEMQAANRALDRVLLWGHYAIPHWANSVGWIAYWDRFGRPAIEPPYDFGFPNTIGFQPTWWIDPERDQNLAVQQ